MLGLLENAGPSTPYTLKQGVAGSVGNFWSVPHSQLYAEPARLAAAGYVTEEQEATGRRRRTYSITAKGRAALREWVSRAEMPTPEIRDPALLKLFFGGDPAVLAAAESERHAAKLEEYRALHEVLPDGGPKRTLEAGIAYAEAMIAYWESILRA